jgi:hypothetical protein
MYRLGRDLVCRRDQERAQRCIATYGSGWSHTNFFAVEKNQHTITLTDPTYSLLVLLGTPVEPSVDSRAL